MKHILFLNKSWGVDFMLIRKLEREKIEFEYVSLAGDLDEQKLYTKYKVRSTPSLIILDNGEESGRLHSTDEIVDYFKNNVSDIKV